MQIFPHFRALMIAIQFLSRIPAPVNSPPTPDELSRAALYYPVVGLLIGLIVTSVAWLFSGAEPLLLAAILLSLWAAITGALHLDGLADSADAWLGGPGNPEKTHRILKDPLIGTAGAVALILILLLKFSALYAIIKQQDYILILLAPVLGRSMILLLFVSTDYVRKQGLAADVVKGLNGQAALFGLIPVLLLAAWLSPFAIISVLLVFVGLRKIMLQRLGGCTGDTAGATVEITEAIWLCSAAIF